MNEKGTASNSEFKIIIGDVEFETEENRESLGLENLGSENEDFYVIQFIEYPKDEWIEALEKIGASVSDYVPNNAYVVRMWIHTIYQVLMIRNTEFIRFVTRYLPEFKISSRLKGKKGVLPLAEFKSLEIIPESVPYNERGNVTVILHDPSYLSEVCQAIIDIGGNIVTTREDSIRVAIDPSSNAIEKIAKIKSVKWIERYVPPKLCLDVSTGIINAPVVWNNHGLDGTGQIVAVADTGLDTGVNDNTMHADFRGRIVDIQALGRKNDASDTDGHGTHVAGTVLGNGASWGLGGTSPKGVAHGASLFFQSVMDSDGGLGGLNDLNKVFLDAYEAGARVHSNSWGAEVNGEYNNDSKTLDKFVWEHRDMVIVIAAGNEAKDADSNGVVDPDSMDAPGTAKNCITVGGCENDKEIKIPGKAFSLPSLDLRNKSDGGKGPLGNQLTGKMFYTGSDKEKLVKRLQKMLNELVYTDNDGNPLKVDGDFGNRTEETVMKFQSDPKNKDLEGNPLKVDGLVGPKTSDALNRAMNGRMVVLTWDVFCFSAAPLNNDPVADDPEGMMAFSSRGPTDDDRIKPDVIAPGSSILSTKSSLAVDHQRWGVSPHPNYMYAGGTSMATPHVAGAAAIVRQHLVSLVSKDGNEKIHWRKKIKDLSPTAALVKAILINGAVKMKGQYPDPQNDAGTSIPNNNQGFGRVDLEQSLFPSSPTLLEIFDGHRVANKERREYRFQVSDATQLKVTLVWTDFPGPRLKNDLTLFVHTPDGQVVGIKTKDNVREILIREFIEKPTPGIYRIGVEGYDVTKNSLGGKWQDYALIIRGHLVSTLKALHKISMEGYPDNPGPLPAKKLCNKNPPFNPIQGDGALGNQFNGRMYYQGSDKEELVKHLQTMLQQLGKDIGPSGIDGKFGNNTEKAVKSFQQENKDWEENPLKVDGLVGPRTSDALNRAMVGRWYDKYETPRELTQDKLLITATKEALQEGVSINPSDVESAKLILVDRVGLNVITLLDPLDNRFSFEGEANFEVLDKDENVLAKGKITSNDDIKFQHSNKPSTVELQVGKTFFTFYVEAVKEESSSKN